ncbi:MAG: hypothetical protein JO184_15920, partial [Gammaproteobacteria bacterium]|nr:hypothetical protein [Gammaproteobacteria bacterium]
QEVNTDTQALWAHNTSGPLQIRDNYIEAAGENVMFGGADSRDASLVPADIEVLNNYIFKPLSLIGSGFTTKNLLEIKSAQRILVSGNVFQNSPAAGQGGTAVVITPRNQNGTAPWSVDTDITITGNTLNNIGGGFGILGTDTIHPSQLTSRLLIRDNVLIITGLNGAQSRAFEVYNGGTSYTIDHNTIVWATPTAGNLAVVETARAKVTDFAFTNNLATARLYGFGSPEGEGTVTLNANFTNWTFAKNVVVAAPAGKYPAGNFFPGAVTDLRMMNFTAANYALAANSPYKGAGTDGRDIGADLANAPSTAGLAPNPPANVIVK